MKQNYYIVTFRNEKTVFVSCFNEEEAKILTQAVMIRKRLTMDVKSIVKTSDISDMADVLLKKIVFIDPIPYRTVDNLYVLEMFKGNMEDMLKKDIFRYNDNKLMAINETMGILHSQLQNLVDEWDYSKEDSANGNR